MTLLSRSCRAPGCATTGCAVPVKLHTIADHFEPASRPCRYREPVQRLIGQILNLATTKTEKMVMEADIGVKAGPVMPIVHLVNEAHLLYDKFTAGLPLLP